MTMLVFDIGGTNMRMAFVRGERISGSATIPTPTFPGDAIDALVTFARGTTVTEARGGIAGVIADGRIIKAPNLPRWEGYAFADALRTALSVPAAIANDAAIEALGEAHYGAGRGFRRVGYMAVGTGVGGALVIDGTLASAAYGHEPGHQIIDAALGKELEEFVGGRALQKETGRMPSTLPQPFYDARTAWLAAGIYNAALHWSPDVMVLGGALIRGDVGFKLVRIEEEVLRIARGMPMPALRVGTLGDQAGFLGAQALPS